MKLECLQLKETGSQADFSVVVIKYRAICFVQMVDGASHGSGWAGCSVKVQQQLLVSVHRVGSGSGSLDGAGGASTQRAFPPPSRHGAVGGPSLVLRRCQQSQFWGCFELSGVEMGRERRESEMERD